jgi:hypothetical protein
MTGARVRYAWGAALMCRTVTTAERQVALPTILAYLQQTPHVPSPRATTEPQGAPVDERAPRIVSCASPFLVRRTYTDSKRWKNER